MSDTPESPPEDPEAPKAPKEHEALLALEEEIQGEENLYEKPAHRTHAEITAEHEFNLAMGFVVLFQTTILYNLDNEAVLPSSNQVMESVNSLLHSVEEVKLLFGDQLIYVNGNSVKMDDFLFIHFCKLDTHLKRLQIREVAFESSISRKDLLGLMQVFKEALTEKNAAEVLAEANFSNIRVADFAEKAGSTPVALTAIRSYYCVLTSIRELTGVLEKAKTAWLAPTKRAIQDLTLMCYVNPTLMIGLTRLPHFQGDHSSRLVNTAVLCAVMCRHLGLNKRLGADIAFSAAIHDFDWTGEGNLRKTILEILRVYRRDPKGRLRTCVISDLNNPDGLPTAQLISVAAAYERLHSLRDNYKQPILPDTGLKYIQSEVGRLFHWDAVKLLVSVLGIFPVGSLVQLSSGHLGVVVEFPLDGRSLIRPVIRLIRSPEGELIENVVDLLHEPKLNVDGCLNPADHNINVVASFFDDAGRKKLQESLKSLLSPTHSETTPA